MELDLEKSTERSITYIFNVRTWVNGDDIAVLDSEVMADNTIDSSAPIVEIVIGKHDQDGVLALLAFHKHGVSPEEL